MGTKAESDLIERVRVALRLEPEVVERRMFGSTGFMIRGKLAIGARTQRIMCRVDPSLVPDLLKRPGCKQVIMRGRAMKGYVHVDEVAVRTDEALRRWIKLVLEQNRSLRNENRDVRSPPSL
jgi:TfoX/Sxy family transcriptional regulator of competence genes